MVYMVFRTSKQKFTVLFNSITFLESCLNSQIDLINSVGDTALKIYALETVFSKSDIE